MKLLNKIIWVICGLLVVVLIIKIFEGNEPIQKDITSDTIQLDTNRIKKKIDTLLNGGKD